MDNGGKSSVVVQLSFVVIATGKSSLHNAWMICVKKL